MSDPVGEVFSLSELTDQATSISVKRYRIIKPFIKKIMSLPTVCKDNGVPIEEFQLYIENLIAIVRKKDIYPKLLN